jgi:endoglucanase
MQYLRVVSSIIAILWAINTFSLSTGVSANPPSRLIQASHPTWRGLEELGRPAFATELHIAAEAKKPNQHYFFRGMNLAGADFNAGKNPGVHGTDYIYPPESHLDYFKSRGFEVVRLPFRWERLQRSLFGELERSELDRIKRFVASARGRDMKVILSPHNFGRYLIDGKEALIGSAGVPNEAFADFWRRLTFEFAGDIAIYGFSLMNEPHDSNELWKPAAQAGLDAIRRSDRDRLVLVPGDQWSGAWSWRRYNNNFLLNDPTGNTVYEAHQYFDFNHSGTYKVGYVLNGAYPDLGIDLVRPFATWLREHQVRGIITEFGVPNDDPRWLELVDRLLVWLARENIPWVYWAGGPWWGNYPLSAEPKNGVDAPIMAVLTKDYGKLRN